MKSIEIIDHPADIGIIVKTDTLKELFVECAKAMFSIITELSKVEKQTQKEVAVSDEELPNLMIGWLEELLYLFDVENIFFCDFEIQSIDNNKIEAIAYGEKLDAEKHDLLTEVKAATYHQLEVAEKDDHWQARIIFDL